MDESPEKKVGENSIQILVDQFISYCPVSSSICFFCAENLQESVVSTPIHHVKVRKQSDSTPIHRRKSQKQSSVFSDRYATESEVRAKYFFLTKSLNFWYKKGSHF